MKTMIAFDLDGTLAESKQPIGDEMAGLLHDLLGVASVAVISGGDWPQFEKQVVGRLPKDSNFSRLFIMPTTGAKLYRFQGGVWTKIYAEDFSDDERKTILTALDKAVGDEKLDQGEHWGERIEDRGAQITFSGLGQEAPLDAKTAWDPDRSKRTRMQATVAAALPGLSIKIGGSTSIDITRDGIDKAYAIRRLIEHSGVPQSAILFLGDAIYPGGNDDPVRAAGTDSIAIRDPAETGNVVRGIVACLRG